MAGSFKHLTTEDGKYAGLGTIENMGDAREALEEMFFMIMYMTQGWESARRIADASDQYYRCARGEIPWPAFMRPGIDE